MKVRSQLSRVVLGAVLTLLMAAALDPMAQARVGSERDYQKQLPKRQEATDPPRSGSITGKSVAAGALSFFVWPGIGQAVNDNRGKKVATHAVLGLLPPYRFWSAYDALTNRQGGYWKGKI